MKRGPIIDAHVHVMGGFSESPLQNNSPVGRKWPMVQEFPVNVSTDYIF